MQTIFGSSTLLKNPMVSNCFCIAKVDELDKTSKFGHKVTMYRMLKMNFRAWFYSCSYPVL